MGGIGNSMRILHIYRTYFPETQGGLQEAIRQIAGSLTGAGYSVNIFTLAKHPNPECILSSEGTIYRSRSLIDLASCDIGNFSGLAMFRRLARQADILNFHYPWPFGDVLELLGNPGKPYVVTYHSDIVRQRAAEFIYSPLRAHFIKKASAIVATSPNYVRTSQYLSELGRPVEIIPLAIDAKAIPEIPDDVLTKWAGRFSEPFFFFVGVLRYYKGLEFLVKAARQSGAHVVIAGSGPEGSRLHDLASGAANIHFLGKVSDEDKFALIHLCRAVVFPSHLRSEAFGVTLLEGASRGKPLISTEIGTGTSYVNLHGETGLVVPGADVDALAQAMQTLIARPDFAEQLGENAKRRCVEMFDVDAMGLAYKRLYERVLNVRN